MLGYVRNFIVLVVVGLKMWIEDLFPAIKRRKLAKQGYSGNELEQFVRERAKTRSENYFKLNLLYKFDYR